VIWGAVLSVSAPKPTAEQLFKEGQKAERAGQIAQAYVLYSQAAAADSTNLMYWQRAQALRPIAALLKRETTPPADLAADKIDSTLFGTISDRELEDARKPLPPPRLEAVRGARDYDLQGDSKSLWEQVAKTLHLLVVFDTQYQPTRSLRFQLADADYSYALRALEAATDSFIVPVSERLIFVANDTTQKRTEFESNVAVAIPFGETLSVQDLQELATGIRGALDMGKLMVDTQRHLILVRDRVTKVRLAEKLILDLLRPRPQVAVDIQILTTDRSSTLNYGLTVPTAFPLVSFVSRRYLTTSLPSGIASFLTFGGGASLLGLGITSANLFANVSKSTAESLLDSEIVAIDGQASTLHVGNKYPLVTNTYIGNTSGGGQVFAPPPTFNFEDLGLVLKITPRVHGIDDVSLDVSAEFKLLGAAAVDGIPVISSRKYESKTRLRAGEWAVLAGLMTRSEAETITGIPGLTLVPVLRSNTKTTDDGETLIVLKPHILNLPPTESPTFRAWSGTETRWAGSF
jgi:type II secretory pathway component GspD/PulD (secretin)